MSESPVVPDLSILQPSTSRDETVSNIDALDYQAELQEPLQSYVSGVQISENAESDVEVDLLSQLLEKGRSRILHQLK